MKLLTAAIVVIGLVGCASNRVQPQGRGMSYEQLSAIQVSKIECKNIDQVVNEMEKQLSLRGIRNANPEDLNDADRQYNARARIIIWSMRIGCNNPNRYRS
jgi:hypothetical protein